MRSTVCRTSNMRLVAYSKGKLAANMYVVNGMKTMLKNED